MAKRTAAKLPPPPPPLNLELFLSVLFLASVLSLGSSPLDHFSPGPLALYCRLYPIKDGQRNPDEQCCVTDIYPLILKTVRFYPLGKITAIR